MARSMTVRIWFDISAGCKLYATCEMLCPGCKPRTPMACPISFDQFPIKSALYTVFGKPISCKCRIAIANIILMKI